MTDDPISYLLERFGADAATLRDRATELAGKPAPPFGPDAEASARMAEACDEVLEQLRPLVDADPDQLTEALLAVQLRLNAQAGRKEEPFVRTVYAGAAARIDEVLRHT